MFWNSFLLTPCVFPASLTGFLLFFYWNRSKLILFWSSNMVSCFFPSSFTLLSSKWVFFWRQSWSSVLWCVPSAQFQREQDRLRCLTVCLVSLGGLFSAALCYNYTNVNMSCNNKWVCHLNGTANTSTVVLAVHLSVICLNHPRPLTHLSCNIHLVVVFNLLIGRSLGNFGGRLASSYREVKPFEAKLASLGYFSQTHE